MPSEIAFVIVISGQYKITNFYLRRTVPAPHITIISKKEKGGERRSRLWRKYGGSMAGVTTLERLSYLFLSI
jgi:hypothetical protein